MQAHVIVDAREAERLIESLKKFDVTQVGSSEWLEQHRKIERLNLQSHQNAMTNSDEYILEAVLTFGKLESQPISHRSLEKLCVSFTG